MDLHAFNVCLHIFAGCVAPLAGSAAVVSVKGGRTHRSSGRVFVAVGGVALTTALLADILFAPPPPLVAATLAASYQYLSSLRALHLRDRGPGLVDALLALAGLSGCGVLLLTMGPGTPSWTPAIGYSTIGYTAFVASYDLSRHTWPTLWLRHARTVDHGLKMTGAYFAMMSAGVGNVLRDLQPWSQVGPSILGLLVMVGLAAMHAACQSPLNTGAPPSGGFIPSTALPARTPQSRHKRRNRSGS